MADPRYPIGKFEPQPYSDDLKITWINNIRWLPNNIEHALLNFNEEHLHSPYRQGGWTIHQLVHHLADSHMNAYIRFKLGVSEDAPTINPYNEVEWAQMSDVQALPVNISITLLHALHRRWVVFLEGLTTQDFDRTIYHPAHQKHISLWDLLGMYAWHSMHHLAHITHSAAYKIVNKED